MPPVIGSVKNPESDEDEYVSEADRDARLAYVPSYIFSYRLPQPNLVLIDTLDRRRRYCSTKIMMIAVCLVRTSLTMATSLATCRIQTPMAPNMMHVRILNLLCEYVLI